MVIKVDVFVNQVIDLLKRFELLAVDTFGFQNRAPSQILCKSQWMRELKKIYMRRQRHVRLPPMSTT